MGLPARDWARGDRYPHFWIPSRRLWTPRVIPGRIQAAITLVGAAGAVSVGVNAASITPAWGAGANRTAGNLLILRVTHHGSQTQPATPSGWTFVNDPTHATAGVGVLTCYRIATGGDAAPTITGIANVVLSGQLCEYAGTDPTAPYLNDAGNSGGTLSPQVATCTGGGDPVAGCLIISAAAMRYTQAATKTFTDVLNNSATQLDRAQSGAVSTTSHYDFISGVTGSNAAADQNNFSLTVTKISGVELSIASFKPQVIGGRFVPVLVQQQGVKRGSLY
jgi:hypothetical protein